MKIAAVWARVSTEGQAELSLDSQTVRAKAELQARGYLVPPDRVLAVDWTSLDLSCCPQFHMLKQWIQRKEIAALGILDRDRLNAVGLQRLTFLADCTEAGVELVICQGPPILDEPEGQLVELALAIGKERSVRRARQGSKDGLHDRATLKGLPTSHHRIYGYRWEGETLVHDANWEVVKLIYSMALQHGTYDYIIGELKRRGIPSPTSKEVWCKPTISSILRNPVYGGRYYALKKEAIQPTTRKGPSYGNSSCRRLPFEQWHHLPKVNVVNPPVTWDEWVGLQERLKLNQQLARRNSKHDYLLRGRIYCDYHRGEHGQPRCYHGRPHHGSWCYVCPACHEQGKGRCTIPFLRGPKTEAEIQTICRRILASPEIIEREIKLRHGRVQATAENLRLELQKLGRKERKNLDAETALVSEAIRNEVSKEAYERNLALLKAEKRWIAEERERLESQLITVERDHAVVVELGQIRERLAAKLDNATNDDWRLIFDAMGMELHITEDGDKLLNLAIPVSHTDTQIVLSAPEHD